MNETNMILYGSTLSPTTKGVLIALQIKKITYEYIEIDLLHKEHYSNSFLSLKIRGKLPLLMHHPEKLRQSLTVGEYINEYYPKNDVFPSSIIDRAWCKSFSGA